MQNSPQITFRHMAPSDALRARVLEHVEHLERFHGRIISCHVVVDTPPGNQRNGGPFDVKVELTLPGRQVHARSERGVHVAHDDVYVALRDAFDSAKRQLQDTRTA